MDEAKIDTAYIDQAVLALMYLTLHDADQPSGTTRAIGRRSIGFMPRS